MGISSEIISGKYAVSDKEAVKWMLDAIRDVRKAWEAASGVGDLPFPLVGELLRDYNSHVDTTPTVLSLCLTRTLVCTSVPRRLPQHSLSGIYP